MQKKGEREYFVYIISNCCYFDFSLLYIFVVSEENYTGEGIPSPLAPSLLVAFYDTQRIRWCYYLRFYNVCVFVCS